VKVLLDECVDWRLAREIVGHDVRTARQMGWTAIKNGELLVLASKHFDVFVTVDRNLCFQQNPAAFQVGVVALQASSNRLADLRPLVPGVIAANEQARRVGTVAGPAITPQTRPSAAAPRRPPSHKSSPR
jgi:hypothetical protein